MISLVYICVWPITGTVMVLLCNETRQFLVRICTQLETLCGGTICGQYFSLTLLLNYRTLYACV